MEINRNNYEAYFIDYLEGNLDEKLVDSFIAFIQANPDLKEELDLFETISAVPENVSFSNKNNLYKEKYDSEKEFETAAIACLEGDISNEEKLEYEMYLAEHPEQQKEAALFGQTKLQTDETITFNKKYKLYRKPLGKVLFMWAGRVAAVLVFALVIYIFFEKNTGELAPKNQLTQTQTEKTVEETTTEIPNSPMVEKGTGKEKSAAPIPEEKQANPVEVIPVITETVEENYIASARIPIEIPAEINSISASITTQKPKATMGTMYLYYPENTSTYYDEKLLVDAVKEKAGFSLRKISKAGLKLVTNISQERFTYETTPKGKVKEYKYDSRLFAFSIPNKKVQPE